MTRTNIKRGNGKGKKRSARRGRALSEKGPQRTRYLAAVLGGWALRQAA